MNKKILLTAGLVLLVFLGWRIFPVFRSLPGSPAPVQPAKEAGEKHKEVRFSPLNGSILPDAGDAGFRPIAVVVENHPDARPQSGLAEADLVYETVAEGGITRFLAIFQSAQPREIGPIRSARTYFAEIADELGAVFVHVGGNSDVLENLKTFRYPRLLDLDQFFKDGFFWRSKARPMPHNVYSSTDLLRDFANNLSGQKWSLPAWVYADQAGGQAGAERLSVPFSTHEYAAGYEYDPAKMAYLRLLAGRTQADTGSAAGIYVKNVVVQSVKTWPVKTDTPFSIGMDLSGGGSAYVFSEGKVQEGVWKKSAGGRTRYFDAAGSEMRLGRGITWIELVPESQYAQVVWQKR